MDVFAALKDYGPVAGVVLTVWLFLKYASPWTASVIDSLDEMRALLIEVRECLKHLNTSGRISN